MRCERYERDLALYVEADLPSGAVASVERHLRVCEGCRAFLSSLHSSQRVPKDLAGESFDEAMLLSLRRRILASVSSPPSVRLFLRPWIRWAVAAVAIVLAVALGLLQRTASREHATLARKLPRVVPATQTSVDAARPRVVSDTLRSSQRSTPAKRKPVSSSVEQRTTAAQLTDEDADQLALAIIAASRVDSLPEPLPTTQSIPTDNGVVLLEAADPQIVVYWQLDSNGG